MNNNIQNNINKIKNYVNKLDREVNMKISNYDPTTEIDNINKAIEYINRLEKEINMKISDSNPTRDKNLLKQRLSLLIKENNKNKLPIKIVCVGTDRVIYDSLGPLVGTMLKEKGVNKNLIEGDLNNPLHATRIASEGYNNIEGYFIIAIDSCKTSDDYNAFLLDISNKSIYPGATLEKDLPKVGDISIKGLIDIPDSFLCNNNIRLREIYSMAKDITDIIYDVCFK